MTMHLHTVIHISWKCIFGSVSSLLTDDNFVTGVADEHQLKLICM